MAHECKELVLGEARREVTSVQKAGGKLKVTPPKLDDARKELTAALLAKKDVAVKTLGAVDYKWYIERFKSWVAEQGVSKEAAKKKGELLDTLTKRLEEVTQMLSEVGTRPEARLKK